MGIRAVPKQGACNKCREYVLRPDVFVEGDVNICGLCLSQPRTRSVLEGAVLEGDKGIRRCKPECTRWEHEACQGGDAKGSALADLRACRKA